MSDYNYMVRERDAEIARLKARAEQAETMIRRIAGRDCYSCMLAVSGLCRPLCSFDRYNSRFTEVAIEGRRADCPLLPLILDGAEHRERV